MVSGAFAYQILNFSVPTIWQGFCGIIGTLIVRLCVVSDWRTREGGKCDPAVFLRPARHSRLAHRPDGPGADARDCEASGEALSSRNLGETVPHEKGRLTAIAGKGYRVMTIRAFRFP